VIPQKPEKPQRVDGNPIPEFMWCQRSDRVFVTIKVADCQNAMVNVTALNVLEFRGHGHGSCGIRDYALRVTLAAGVKAEESKWFVCGPSVRVRLEKEKVGPYWNALMSGTKLAQCKVDWQSWLDEDEETEVSGAPNGFEVNDMHMMMVGESLEFYRDLDKLSSSEEEGEEENSIMMDQGMNNLDQLQHKFRALDVEKEIRAQARDERRLLRQKTREAQKFEAQRKRDLGYGREVRDFTEEELSLLAGASTLRERLKKQKAAEKEYWAQTEHHQMRPQAADQEKARAAATKAAQAALENLVDQMGIDLDDADSKQMARKIIREAALEAAYKEVGYKDAAPTVAHEIAAAAARAAVGDPPAPPIEAAAEAKAAAAAEAAGMRYAGLREMEDKASIDPDKLLGAPTDDGTCLLEPNQEVSVAVGTGEGGCEATNEDDDCLLEPNQENEGSDTDCMLEDNRELVAAPKAPGVLV